VQGTYNNSEVLLDALPNTNNEATLRSIGNTVGFNREVIDSIFPLEHQLD